MISSQNLDFFFPSHLFPALVLSLLSDCIMNDMYHSFLYIILEVLYIISIGVRDSKVIDVRVFKFNSVHTLL